MAEIELGIFGRQCLDQRIDSIKQLKREVSTWERERNARAIEVAWRFTTTDARVKPKRPYPSIE